MKAFFTFYGKVFFPPKIGATNPSNEKGEFLLCLFWGARQWEVLFLTNQCVDNTYKLIYII